MSMSLYKVEYEYTVSQSTDWFRHSQNVLAGQDALLAVETLKKNVLSSKVVMNSQKDPLNEPDNTAPPISDQVAVTDFRLISVSEIEKVDQVCIQTLIDDNIITHADDEDDGNGGDAVDGTSTPV